MTEQPQPPKRKEDSTVAKEATIGMVYVNALANYNVDPEKPRVKNVPLTEINNAFNEGYIPVAPQYPKLPEDNN